MKTGVLVVGAVSLVVLSLIACKKDDPPPATPIPSVGAGTGTAPTGTAPGYQQPGYQPAGATSAVPGQLATPGPTALACQNDSMCMFHHCNMQFQKCAFPCRQDTDCIQGSHCNVALGELAICTP